MNRLSLIILFSVLILLSTSQVHAWTSYTHKWICDKAGLSNLDCISADNPKVQSQRPGLNFKYHHCTSDLFNCDARVHAGEFLAINTTESRGFAAHLFADSMVPVHWYSTDYDSCHKIFEDLVEEKLRKVENVKYDLFGSSFDFSVWNVTMQCQAKFGKENKTVELYVNNQYMDTTAKYVASEMRSSYMSTGVKEYDLTPIIYVLFAFLVVIFMLFLYIGLKNKKRNLKRK